MVAIIRFSSVVGLASAISLQSASSSQTASLESWGEVAGVKESGRQVPGKKLNDSDEIPEEDFIPLVSPEISVVDYRYVCKHERGEEDTDDWEVVDVHVSKGIGVRTRYIACPKTYEWGAFRIEFDWAEPGTDAGSDPLSSLDDSTFRGILDVLDPYARGEHGNFYYVRNLEFYVLTGKPLCLLVTEAMKKEYGTFINLCRKYYPLRRK
ncbi:hypothetical protein FOZ62_031269 [Perkinsus olseni]|uniref:Uncharacterized protein n=1 Tax=Perkinsus olseni TaxID=32597 RepID=A0A7J6UAK2_PEROL|nr:hypothetical protein FOZ62_031269 [Perkinsus olseni]